MLKSKLEKKNYQNFSKVYCLDVLKAIKKIKGPFDIIFADPPYSYNNIFEIFNLAENQNLFHANSLIFYEHSKHQEVVPQIGKLFCIKSKNYGDSTLTIFNYSNH